MPRIECETYSTYNIRRSCATYYLKAKNKILNYTNWLFTIVIIKTNQVCFQIKSVNFYE